MGITRLSSACELPQRDWIQATAGVDDVDTPKAFLTTPTLVIRALILAPSSNPADVTFGPDANANFHTLIASDQYLIESEPGHSFDLSRWYLRSLNASAVLKIIYQQANP